MKREPKTGKNRKKRTSASEKKKKKGTAEEFDTGERFFGSVSNERLGEFQDLADSIAQSFDSRVLSLDERRQAALIGIARGLDSFRDGKSSEKTWLTLKGNYAVQEAIRREMKRIRKDPTAKRLHFEEEIPAAPVFDDDSDDAEKRDAKRAQNAALLSVALATLDARTRDIVVAVHFHGMKQKEVARRFGISQSWTSRLNRNGLDKMRAYLAARIDFEVL